MKLARQVLQWSVQNNICVPAWNAASVVFDELRTADSEPVIPVVWRLFQ